MIRHLHIKDYVLIHELDLDLAPGFLAITGETGAGKSILMGAIGLAAGNRADSRQVREGAAKAVVEIVCDAEGIAALPPLFEGHDLDLSPLCTLRREITAAGKSRAFINDTPVTAQVMKEVADHLIDIHSQHHNMLIGDPAFQREVVDTLCGSHPLLTEYQTAYHAYQAARRQLNDERERLEQARREADYIRFQYEQLNEAHLLPDEVEQIEERLSLAHNAQEIVAAYAALAALSDGDDDRPSPLDHITAVQKSLTRAARAYAPAEEYAQRIESLRIEFSELTSDAASLIDDLAIDSGEVQQLEQRIDLLQGLLFKHNLSTTAQLIALRDSYGAQLAEVDTADEHLRELDQSLQQAHAEATRLATLLTQQRQGISPLLLPELHTLMQELGVKSATFEVDIQPTAELTPTGRDQITFLFATNKQSTLRPIREIASGGEISRVMLALKAILGTRTVLPTLFFDEIDTGVSGEVASRLGHVMHRLSRGLQVLTITHLPQIAAIADHHYLVSKSDQGDTYTTSIREIEGEERVTQLATMLSGSQLTAAAIENARTLLLPNM